MVNCMLLHLQVFLSMKNAVCVLITPRDQQYKDAAHKRWSSRAAERHDVIFSNRQAKIWLCKSLCYVQTRSVQE